MQEFNPTSELRYQFAVYSPAKPNLQVDGENNNFSSLFFLYRDNSDICVLLSLMLDIKDITYYKGPF
jgi:hypothetical protein